jgi:hypothetical protein
MRLALVGGALSPKRQIFRVAQGMTAPCVLLPSLTATSNDRNPPESAIGGPSFMRPLLRSRTASLDGDYGRNAD